MKIQQIRTCSLCFLLLLVMGLSSPAFSRSRNVRVFVPPATKPLVNTFALEESVLLDIRIPATLRTPSPRSSTKPHRM